MAERETDEARTEASDGRDEQSSGDGAQTSESGSASGDSATAEQKGEGGERQQDGDGSGDSEKEQLAKEQRKKREEEKKKEEEGDQGPALSLKRLHWAEFVGFAGSVILVASLWLKWFATDCVTNAAARRGEDCNPNSVYNGERGEFTAFETFKYLDWLLIAASVAPFILAYIIVRGHKLSWRPGEVTMIVGMIAFALIVLNGFVLGKPGDTVDMHFEIGYLVGIVGAFLIMLGGVLRQALGGKERKPPGVM